MKLIDADAFLSNYKGNILTAQTDYAQGARDIMDDIRNAPTIDAIPVVRCKYCSARRTCDLYLIYGCDENNFCSFGRTNEAN